MLRRLHATLSAPLKLDPVRPEYHRAALQWMPPSPQVPAALGWTKIWLWAAALKTIVELTMHIPTPPACTTD